MLYNFISYYILNFFLVAIISVLYSEKVYFFKLNIYITTFFLTLMSLIIIILPIPLIPLCGLMSIFVANYIYTRKEFKQVFISTFIIEFLIIISELVTLMIAIPLSTVPDINKILVQYGVQIIGSITLIFMYLIIMFSAPRKIYLYLDNRYNRINSKYFISGAFFIFVCVTFGFYSVFFEINVMIFLLFILIVFLVCIKYTLYIIEKSIKVENERKMYQETRRLYLEQESLLDIYKMKVHEFKNQAKILKRFLMLNTGNNKELNRQNKKYINSIIEHNKDIIEPLELTLNKINCYPIKFLLINKIPDFVNDNINFEIIINEDVFGNEYELSEPDAFDISNSMAVFIDNAIYESKNIKKNYLLIHIYREEETLIIDIGNKYRNKTDLENIGKPKFTTKGKGHGYGLNIVNNIVRCNKRITTTRIINNDFFKQRLCVILKLKKPK